MPHEHIELAQTPNGEIDHDVMYVESGKIW